MTYDCAEFCMYKKYTVYELLLENLVYDTSDSA